MKRGLAAASAALVLLVACDRHDGDQPSPTPSASGGGTITSAPTPSPERAAALQMRPVVMVVHPVDSAYTRTTVACGNKGGRPCTADELTRAPMLVLTDADGNRYSLGPVVVDGNDVANAAAIRSPFGGEWAVEYELTTVGAERFALAADRVISFPSPRNAIAIVFDGRVISAPIMEEIRGGRGRITFVSERDAKALAAQVGGPVA